MRRPLLHLMLVFAATVAFAASLGAQAKPNFSGTWTLVPGKSDFGPMPTPSSMTRTITHTDPTLKIVTVQTNSDTGDTTVSTTFTTDGKPATNTVSGNQMTTTGKWDGAAIVLSSSMSMLGTDIGIEDRYELSDGGKTLTVTRKVSSPQGDFTATIVMTKK